jgi:hypothetical protein
VNYSRECHGVFHAKKTVKAGRSSLPRPNPEKTVRAEARDATEHMIR